MSAIKPNREFIVSEILSEMDFGISYTDCLAINSEKWQIPQRTFDRYWAEARKRFSELTEATQIAFEALHIEGKKEALKKAILTKHERMEILTKMAKGEIMVEKPIVCDGMIQMVEVAPALADRKNAIAELNKMDGEYAPIKKDITSKGEKIIIDFTD